MTDRREVEALFAQYVEHHVLHGERPNPDELCREHPELLAPLKELIQEYEKLDETLTASAIAEPPPTSEPDQPLPTFKGFRTIERLGGGGGGEVFKLADVQLGRFVAAKVLRPDKPLGANVERFLQEARSLALFEDPRIVRLFELRSEADQPVLLTEYVDGFELSHIGPSLEYKQRARLVAEIAEAIHRAHTLGIQHRDLKPGNILIDAQLSPKILDFGLAGRDPGRGHGVGTPAYMAPEQLDPAQPIDARTDIYALGVILYELLCGVLPYHGDTQDELLEAIRAGHPRLPVEVEPAVPEALQAIALHAMAVRPADRYASAHEMALDLRRYLDGRPVLARPRLYESALQSRVRPHLEHIGEWLRMRLIYDHEAERLHAAYQSLNAREDDWIVETRRLSMSQIALYLGAFLLLCGSMLYFVAYHMEAVAGLASPAGVLALPFLGLNVVALLLYQRGQKAVAVAYYLAAVVLLPLFLLIAFDEMGLWPVGPESTRQLLGEGFASNRQLQAASLVACVWACWLALSTRTGALSACFAALALAFNCAVLADFGLREWFEDGRYHHLALHLIPFFILVTVLARLSESRQRPWFARPLYFMGVILFVLILELVALNGKALSYLGISMTAFRATEVSNPTLLETVTAMTLNGVIIYCAAWLLARQGSDLMKSSASLLFTICPFAILEPLAYLNKVGEYSRRFDWLYLALAVGITFAAHFRQRKSFYYAGLINTAVALWFITDHYEWFDRPAWSVAIVATGLTVLLAGFALYSRERKRGTS
jgi:serine/threonine protein kinase